MFINQVRSYWSMILCLTLMFGMVIPITGCSSVQDAIIVAEQATHSASLILQPIDPDAAAKLLTVEADLKLTATLYADYELAASADKPGIANKIEAVLTATTNHLQEIMTAIGVGSTLAAEITVAVGIANAIVTLITNKLPKVNNARITTARGARLLPLSKSKSAAGLKNEWNAAVAVNHPKSRI